MQAWATRGGDPSRRPQPLAVAHHVGADAELRHAHNARKGREPRPHLLIGFEREFEAGFGDIFPADRRHAILQVVSSGGLSALLVKATSAKMAWGAGKASRPAKICSTSAASSARAAPRT